MDRAREEASRPESRQVGRQALAEIRRMLGLGKPTSGIAMPPDANGPVCGEGGTPAIHQASSRGG